MGMLKLPKAFLPGPGSPGKKPPEPGRIDRTNPFGRHVAAAWLFDVAAPEVRDVEGTYPVTTADADDYFERADGRIGRYLRTSIGLVGNIYKQDAPDLRDLFVGGKPWTLAVHGRFLAAISNSAVFGVDGSDDFVFYIYEDASKTIRLFWRDVSTSINVATNGVYDNEWIVVTLGFNGDRLRLQVNGETLDEQTGVDTSGAGPFSGGPDLFGWRGGQRSANNDFASIMLFDADITEGGTVFARDPYQVLKPANDLYYFPVSAAGGGTTGTGQADSDDSTTSGSGTLERSGTGTATSGNAITSGEGTAFTIITGSGSAESNDATLDGTGEREITGTVSALSNDASSEGTGTRTITGTAVAESEDTSTDGTGAVEGAITGSGAAVSQNASTSGTGEIETAGTGVAESDDAVTSGVGTLERSGTGTAVSEDATTSGTGTVGSAVTGSGSATSEDAETSGSGARVIKGLGSPVSSDAETTGSGIRAITSNVVIFMENASTSGVGERTITGSGGADSGDANTNGFDVFTEDFHTLQNFLNENYPIEGALGDKFRHFLVLKGYTDNKHNYDLFWYYLEDNGFLNDSLWDKYHAATKDGWLWRQA